MTHLKQFICGLLFLSAAPLSAAENHDHAAHMGQANDCSDAALACSDKAQPFFDQEGRLWLAWQGGGRIAVASSADGKSFTPAVFVTPEPIAADVGADSRPQIVRDGSGIISIIYSVMQKSGYNGRIYLSQSKDGGVSFSTPRPVTNDAASQRFPTLAVDKSGRALAVWIDKRTARAAKQPYDGAALAFAWIDGAGAQPSSIMRENSCECCRVAMTFDTAGNPTAMWRQIFPGMIRDHAVMTFKDGMPGPTYRVAEDKWNIDACPHHGPAIAVAGGGFYHVAWFTEGDARRGLFYAASQDGGAHFTPPEPIGAADKNPGRAQLLAVGNDVWLAWQEFDGITVSVLAKKRVGAGWTPSRVLATTRDASDLPVLIAKGSHPYLSWLTAKEGYRLISLEAAP